MCGGYIGKVANNIGRAVAHPGTSLKKLAHNPADMILGNNIRKQSFYRNVARPVIKTGTGALAGYVTSGFNPMGAVYGGLTSALGGGLNNKAFSPITNVVMPAVAGYQANPNDYISNALGSAKESISGALSGTASDAAGKAASQAATDVTNQAASSAGSNSIQSIIANPASAPGISPIADGAVNAATNAAPSIAGFQLPTSLSDVGNLALKGGKALINNPKLLGAGLQMLGGNGQALPGQQTDAQRAQAAAENARLSSPDAIRSQIAQIRQNPQIQTMLNDIRGRVTRQVRDEFMSAYGSQLSAAGGWGSSQQQQLEQQMAGTLTQRLASAENDFLMSQLGTELNTTGAAVNRSLAQPLATRQPSTISNIGSLIAAL